MAILGLLLAESEFAPPEPRALLEASYQSVARRIKSLLEVHQMLSASEWSPLLLSELIERVIFTERSGYAPDDRMEVQVTPSSLQVSPRQASNLALVVNELFANSCKHATDAVPALQVQVTLAAADGSIAIEYRDNGGGYHDDVLNRQISGVGFYLIQRIVEGTLRGSVTLTNDGGAVTRIRIPAERSEHTGKGVTA
jgi:two-component sensor histidine kinase